MIYTITHTITNEQVDDLMDAALKGISYWAGEAKIPKTDSLDGIHYTSEALTHGKTIRIYDAEDEKWYVLTLSKLLKGLSLYTKVDVDDFDMYDADNVVQLALFGEVIYG